MEPFLFDSEMVQAATLALVVSALPLGVSMLVGLLVSVLQAATQIQEQTLTFVPKLLSVAVVLFFFGPWMCGRIVEFASAILVTLAELSKTA